MVLWCRKRGLFQPKEGRFLKQPIYNTALYLRLSRDDEQQGDSGSIQTQENICQGGFHSSEIPLWLSVSKDSTTVPQAPLTVAIDDPKSSISLQCASKTDGTTCPIFIAKYYSCRKRLPCSCICLIVFSRDKSIPLLCMY